MSVSNLNYLGSRYLSPVNSQTVQIPKPVPYVNSYAFKDTRPQTVQPVRLKEQLWETAADSYGEGRTTYKNLTDSSIMNVFPRDIKRKPRRSVSAGQGILLTGRL